MKNPTRGLSWGFTNMLGSYDKLKKFSFFRFFKANAPQGHRASPLGIARSVAFLISLSLAIAIPTPVGIDLIEETKPKTYIRFQLDHKQANCLIKLYSKESAFNPSAVGNLNGSMHTYGIPQIKNAIVGTLSPIEQIDYGIKYIEHRYKGDTCKAYAHFIRHGWH